MRHDLVVVWCALLCHVQSAASVLVRRVVVSLQYVWGSCELVLEECSVYKCTQLACRPASRVLKNCKHGGRLVLTVGQCFAKDQCSSAEPQTWACDLRTAVLALRLCVG